MKRTNMIIAVSILLLIACALVMTSCSSANYETNEHKISETFTDLSIDTDTADVILIPSADGECRVVCYEHKKVTHAVSVKDGTLTVSAVDSRSRLEKIGGFGEPNITIYLPEGEYARLTVESDTGDIEIPDGFSFSDIDVSGSTGDVECSASVTGAVKITMSTGDIELSDMSAKSISVKVSTGDIELSNINCETEIKTTLSTGKLDAENIRCQSFVSDASTGNTNLTDVVASAKFEVERSTGDVIFSRCDGAEVYITTDTGNVRGSFLSDKIIFADTDTGRVDVPKLTAGGRCEISTHTGNIIISIE